MGCIFPLGNEIQIWGRIPFWGGTLNLGEKFTLGCNAILGLKFPLYFNLVGNFHNVFHFGVEIFTVGEFVPWGGLFHLGVKFHLWAENSNPR